MTQKSTPKVFKILLLSICFLLGNSAYATPTYCYPTFSVGCSTWSNQSISIGTINWSLSTCTTYDYTSMSTNITPGVATPMSVTSGNYCGCAVWVDLNNNGSFDDPGENFHTEYFASATGVYTYNFAITLPGGTPAGSYRMRVLAGWGADGTTGNPYPTGNGVGACGPYHYGNFDDFTLVVVGSATCSQPTGLAISNIQSNSATVSWVAPTSGTPTGYTWEVVASGAGATSAPIASGTTVAPTTTATATGLAPATSYDLYVHTTCSPTDSSVWTVPTSFTTTALPNCDTAMGLAASAITSNSAYISWTAVTGASGYEYVLDQNAGNPAGAGTSTTNTFYTATGLTPNTNYYFHLRTDCVGAATATSAWITIPLITLDTCLPPTNVTASNITSTSATITWTAAPAATSYQYVIDNTSTSPTGAGTSIASTTYNASGLAPNTTYYFHILSVCSGTNQSVWITIPFTTLPTGIATVNGNNNIIITANPNPAKDIVTITVNGVQTGKVHLLLTDMTGKTIQTIYLNNNKSMVDVSALSAGVYFIHFSDDMNQQTIKLVK